MNMKYTAFVHTNEKQIIGALVAQYAMRRHSRHGEKFDVRIIRAADHEFLGKYDGRHYLRDGAKRVWLYDDLQSFTPLRFMPPELMDYEGRALVIDPDVFAAGDVWELLTRDMHEKAIVCRPRSGSKGRRGCLASSVMLLDCGKLLHWRCEEQFEEMFRFERDYMEWISLKLEPRDSIQLFEHAWNDFDNLDAQTRLLHNTKRKTQPWKAGLKVDYFPPEKPGGSAALGWLYRQRRRLLGDYALMGRYAAHPDAKQEHLFFGLLRECLEEGIISEEMIRHQMQRNHVRHDAIELLDRVPPVSETLASLRP